MTRAELLPLPGSVPRATIVRVATWLLLSDERMPMTIPFATLVVPLGRVAETKVTFGGNTLVMATPVAVEGPRFETVTV